MFKKRNINKYILIGMANRNFLEEDLDSYENPPKKVADSSNIFKDLLQIKIMLFFFWFMSITLLTLNNFCIKIDVSTAVSFWEITI